MGTVEKFLCCCELQTGVKLVGVLTLLGALCGCFTSSILLSLSALGTAAANGAFGQFNFTNANNDLAGFSQDKKDAMAGLGLSGDAQSVATTVLACFDYHQPPAQPSPSDRKPCQRLLQHCLLWPLWLHHWLLHLHRRLVSQDGASGAPAGLPSWPKSLKRIRLPYFLSLSACDPRPHKFCQIKSFND